MPAQECLRGALCARRRQLLPIAQNPALLAVIGATFGRRWRQDLCTAQPDRPRSRRQLSHVYRRNFSDGFNRQEDKDTRCSREKGQANHRFACPFFLQTILPLVQSQLLHPQITQFPDIKRIFRPAVYRVDCSKLLQQLPCPTEFPNNGPVQTHLEDFPPGIDVIRRVGIGNIKNRIRPPGHTHSLWVADARKRSLKCPVIIKNLDSFIAPVPRINVPLCIPPRCSERPRTSPGAVPFLPHDLINFPSLSNLAIRAFPAPSATKILPSRIPRHISRAVEQIGSAARPRRRGEHAHGTFSDSALRPSSIATSPCVSNFITIFVNSSTTHRLSAGSTRTWAATIKP